MLDLNHINILQLVEQDTTVRRVASTNGGEWAGSCPFCGGRDRFRVWPDHPSGNGRFWCRRCNESGNALNYIRNRKELSFSEACEELGIPRLSFPEATLLHRSQKPENIPVSKFAEAVKPPCKKWQSRGREFINYTRGVLWSDEGCGVLNLLRERGLSDNSIERSLLGYNPGPLRDDRNCWGSEDSKRIYLAPGVVIPNMDVTESDQLWGIGIRQIGDDVSPKYISVRGSRPALYGPQAISVTKPVVLVEGEFDALIIDQEVGDLVTAVATGSTAWCRKVHWIAQLTRAPSVLVAYDDDESGEKASAWWLDVLGSKAMRWRPGWDDANAMHVDGACLRSWLAFPLSQIQIERNVTQDRREK